MYNIYRYLIINKEPKLIKKFIKKFSYLLDEVDYDGNCICSVITSLTKDEMSSISNKMNLNIIQCDGGEGLLTVDGVLDKISENGIESLRDDENIFLAFLK